MSELAQLQPTPGYMRLLRESVLQIWRARKAAVHEELQRAERAAKAIQDKLDRLDGAFLFEARSTLRRTTATPSLDQRQRFQQLFFHDGIAFDGNRFVGTGATAPCLQLLAENQNRK